MHTSHDVCAATGATYRQLDQWDRDGVLSPSGARAQGSGSRRVYTDEDVRLLRLVVLLSGIGCPLSTVVADVVDLMRGLPDEAWMGTLCVTPSGRCLFGGEPQLAGWTVNLARCAVDEPVTSPGPGHGLNRLRSRPLAAVG